MANGKSIRLTAGQMEYLNWLADRTAPRTHKYRAATGRALAEAGLTEIVWNEHKQGTTVISRAGLDYLAQMDQTIRHAESDGMIQIRMAEEGAPEGGAVRDGEALGKKDLAAAMPRLKVGDRARLHPATRRGRWSARSGGGLLIARP